MNLRADQIEAIKGVYAALKRSPVVTLVMPTGCGKTLTSARIAVDAARRGWRVAFVVNRVSLLDQTDVTFRRLLDDGISVGWVWADVEPIPDAPIQIVSIQSLEAGHGAHVKEWIGKPKTLVIIDEAHETALRTSVLPWLMSPGLTWFLLLTATPDSKGRHVELGDVCSEMVAGLTYTALIDLKALVATDYQMMSPRIDVTGCRVSSATGDYSDADIEAPAISEEVLSGVVQAWQREDAGRRTVAFCSTVRHAMLQAEAFAAAGIRTGVITGTAAKTGLLEGGRLKRLDRHELTRMLAAHELDILTSVEAISAGWDCPPVEVGYDLRPSLIRSAWIQRVGRIKRASKDTGKTGSIWRDFAGNRERFGKLEWIEGWELPKGRGKGEKRAAVEPVGKDCPTCGSLLRREVMQCDCGHKWEPPPLPKRPGFGGFSPDDNPKYLGMLEARIKDIPVKIFASQWQESQWGGRYWVAGESADGRRFAGYLSSNEKGKSGTLSGTVKKHGSFRGYPQTILERCRFKEVEG